MTLPSQTTDRAAATDQQDLLTIGSFTLSSRLIVGSGRYQNAAMMRDSLHRGSSP